MNNYCNLIKGMYIEFDLSFPEGYTEIGDDGIEMCFYQVKNSYDALNKTFLISDYLSDKTWPNETGLYITPNFTLTDLSKAGNGYEDKFVFKGNNDSGIINKLSYSLFH